MASQPVLASQTWTGILKTPILLHLSSDGPYRGLKRSGGLFRDPLLKSTLASDRGPTVDSGKQNELNDKRTLRTAENGDQATVSLPSVA